MDDERANRILLSRNSYSGKPIQITKLSDNYRNVEVVYQGKHLYLKQSFRLVPDGTYNQPVTPALLPYIVIDKDVYPMATFASFMTKEELGLTDLEDDVVETPADQEYDDYLDENLVPLVQYSGLPIASDPFAEGTTDRIKGAIKPAVEESNSIDPSNVSLDDLIKAKKKSSSGASIGTGDTAKRSSSSFKF